MESIARTSKEKFSQSEVPQKNPSDTAKVLVDEKFEKIMRLMLW
jgi:hypothetical protein